MSETTAPRDPERLAEIRSIRDRIAERRRIIDPNSRMDLADRTIADLLDATNDLLAEVDRLQAAQLNLNRWVERVNAKRMAPGIGIPDDLWAKAQARAAERGESVSAAVRKFLEEYVK